ncbi:MAG: Nucleoside triphosphate pyrophosphohydrolase MazG [uncultured Gemmatimonadaceae bacterium]|uniref:Nucleoside triphosphate pyrophosphohydrolase MazG n=1 Tax=uncultured Gemmatimonadaceae bacterium TaxID=246130 RepID=A0A6J4L9X2_9BACT|nr:MAG: Nucleoside triphosphate pyrophosphohydrolase MazG [uncultured Gemmatimonadaceae bacterium]
MQDKPSLEDTLALMRDLRARCDWDRAQTHESLRPYLVEEAHEVDDALRLGDATLLREELGDLLLQVLFHSVIAEEAGEFTFADVCAGLIAKMHARHPHLYGDGVKREWEAMKASKRRSIAEGLATGLPALHRAHRLQDRAAGVGFDWPDAAGPADKVAEELGEVRAELARRPAPDAAGTAPAATPDPALEGELGDLLFAVVNLCRKTGVHASLALDRANAKFAARFEAVERLAAERGIDVRHAGLAVLDGLWDEVKLTEAP